MRVLIIGFDVSLYGSALAMAELSKYLKRNNVDVYVTLPQHGLLENRLRDLNIPYKVIPYFNWIFHSKNILIDNIKYLIKLVVDWIAEVRIYRYIRKNEISIVHINTIAVGAGARAAKWAGIKLVWHIRELVEEGYGCVFHNEKKAYQLISSSDYIVAISQYVYDKYCKFLSGNKMHVIYDGIDIEKYQVVNNRIFASKRTVIAFTGKLYKEKGQHELIEAVKDIATKYNLEIWFIGSGEQEYIDELKIRVNELGIEQHVKFWGFQEEPEKISCKADIAVVCSKSEAFGRVTVEAMLEGLLVIGAEDGGTKEIIKHKVNGLLYTLGDTRELAECIEYALTHKDNMREIALRGQDMARRQFSVSNNAEVMQAVYEHLVNEEG